MIDDRTMPLATNEFARRDAHGVETLASPARLNWVFDGLPTSDSHALRVRFSCGLRVADNPTDRRMFAQVLLSRTGSVNIHELTEHFTSSLRAAAASIAVNKAAEQWIGERSTEAEMRDALVTAARATAFACGLELVPPFQVELFSPRLQQQKLETIARARAQERAAGQVQHLQQAAEVLKQFNALRAAAPDLPA